MERGASVTKHFRYGLFLNNFTEDKKSGAAYASAIKSYLDEVADGFDSIWVPDHLSTGMGARDVLECISTLSYLSAQYTKHVFGTLVLCNGFRNPALTAKTGATLDLLTGGRFILGIGAGWYDPEFREHGYEYPPGHVRADQLGEAVKLMRMMWAEDNVTFHGKYYSVEGVCCHPKPRGIPLMVGGTGEKRSLRIAAKYADIWNASQVSQEVFARKAKVLDEQCEKMGRDPSTLMKTAFLLVYLAETDAEARRLFKSRHLDVVPTIVGSPKTVSETLRTYRDAGAEGLILGVRPFLNTKGTRMLVDEVLPELE